jgi:hypothetical protein
MFPWVGGMVRGIEERDDWHIGGSLPEDLEAMLKRMVLLDAGDEVDAVTERCRRVIREKTRFEKVAKAGIYRSFTVIPRSDGYVVFIDVTCKVVYDSPEHPLTVESTGFTEFHPYVSEGYDEGRNSVGKEFMERFRAHGGWGDVGREHR